MLKRQQIKIIAAACAVAGCLCGCQENSNQKQSGTVSETESVSPEADNSIEESSKESTGGFEPAQSDNMTAESKEQELSSVNSAETAEKEDLNTQKEGSETQTSIDDLAPGSVLDASEISDPSAYFRSYEITQGDAVWQEINGKSWHENDNIALSDLRYLKMLHYNFNHQIQVGEMIVNVAITEDTLQVFRDLFDQQYEIEQMLLADHFWTGDPGDTDENSIEHNNTSAFNYREITGGGKLSNHALGRAIDMNPQQNPYIYLGNDGNYRWDHQNASPYIDRTTGDPHVIVSGDVCQTTFEKYGFSWGGYWRNPKDYQHFEKK